MGLVVLPNTLTNGTTADADEVQGNDNALRDGVNNIESVNIVDGTIVDVDLDTSISPVTRFSEIGARSFVVDGLNWITSTTSGDLNFAAPAFVSYVGGVRISNPGFNNLYTALRDTYVDQDDLGVLTFSAVTNGGTAPAQVPGTLRLLKVVTGVSTVDDVVTLAAPSAFKTTAGPTYKYVEANITRNLGSPTSTGNQLIFMQFKGFDSTGEFEIDTTETGVTIDLGNKQLPNGFDSLGNPTVSSVLHIYAIIAQDGSQPVAGLASAGSTFADAGPYPVNFPVGYDASKYVGSLYIEPDGTILPSIQNDKETVFYGGFIRDIWAAADNNKWVHKDLTAFMSLDHSRQVQLYGRSNGGVQQAVGSQGIANNDVTAPNSIDGNVIYTQGNSISGDPTLDTNSSWQPVSKDGIIVTFQVQIVDGTANNGQGDLKGGPQGFSVTGWRYFHD